MEAVYHSQFGCLLVHFPLFVFILLYEKSNLFYFRSSIIILCVLVWLIGVYSVPLEVIISVAASHWLWQMQATKYGDFLTKHGCEYAPVWLYKPLRFLHQPYTYSSLYVKPNPYSLKVLIFQTFKPCYSHCHHTCVVLIQLLRSFCLFHCALCLEILVDVDLISYSLYFLVLCPWSNLVYDFLDFEHLGEVF